ncbi:copper resistance protein B [Qipengyuania sp. GH1]|uniref:copper resistance protein B n=1 Tax=Qipengyuania aestuarii TaxID=2867241 RepID=UPI001C88DA86|nr:copper resistance protein B [Qipengyuania aestuarii]MBX7536336.1 copper resistance protein B [Qipengyuania aestuarii]
MSARTAIAAPVILPLLLSAAQLAAQGHAADHGQDNSGHTMPDHSAHQQQEQAPEPDQPMAGHDGHARMDHSGHAAAPKAGAMPMDHSAHQTGELPSGSPPPAAFEGPLYAADAIFGAATMAQARETNRATHGDMKTGTLMAERLEARIADGHDAFLWDVQGWYGGDIDKFVLKSEGEGAFGGGRGGSGGGVEDAEIQALWGHAIGPWFDLQAGARLDLEPETRSHLVLGVQGLAPYMFHVDAAAFLSDRGDLTARIEGEYDYKLTQRLILQPRAELELAAQDLPERESGSGLTKLETGLRLRYELAREFAPYVGVGYEAKLGETADLARAAGEDPDGLALLLGLRAWF